MSEDSSTTSGQTFDRKKFIGGRPQPVVLASTAPDPVEVTR
jgi:hypothetical protein